MYNDGMCDNLAVKCPLCIELNQAESAISDLVLAMQKMQKTYAPVMRRYEEIHRAHPRCALCTIMTGGNHLEKDLVPEPMVPRAKGQKRYSVCLDCYKVLKSVKRSVPQEIKYSRHVEEELTRLDEDDNKAYDGFWKKFRDANKRGDGFDSELDAAIDAAGGPDEEEGEIE